ncbi:glycosyltransferase family 2 protein, partial [Soehngenia saccharolytica]
MNISVCIIVKNEQNNIEHCLKCLTPYMPEIIVVDTGSTDNTKAIASQYTDRVYDFPWINDFAAAKNFAISKATNSYVMVLDSDEFIESLDIQKLQEELQKHPYQVGRIFRRNVFERNGIQQENTEWINRIFSKELFHYEGCIHEQVTAINGEAYKTYQTPVVILH